MSRRRYAIQRRAPRILEVSWKSGMNDVQVRLEGTLLGGFADGAELKTGRVLSLPDGRNLHVQLRPRRWGPIEAGQELVLEIDGVPVPGTEGDPRVQSGWAGRAILFLGLLELFFSFLVAILSRNGGAPGLLFLEGLVLIVLAIPVWRGSRTALQVAMADIAAVTLVAITSIPGTKATMVIFRVALLAYLWLRYQRIPVRKQPRGETPNPFANL